MTTIRSYASSLGSRCCPTSRCAERGRTRAEGAFFAWLTPPPRSDRFRRGWQGGRFLVRAEQDLHADRAARGARWLPRRYSMHQHRGPVRRRFVEARGFSQVFTMAFLPARSVAAGGRAHLYRHTYLTPTQKRASLLSLGRSSLWLLSASADCFTRTCLFGSDRRAPLFVVVVRRPATGAATALAAQTHQRLIARDGP